MVEISRIHHNVMKHNLLGGNKQHLDLKIRSEFTTVKENDWTQQKKERSLVSSNHESFQATLDARAVPLPQPLRD